MGQELPDYLLTQSKLKQYSADGVAIVSCTNFEIGMYETTMLLMCYCCCLCPL